MCIYIYIYVYKAIYRQDLDCNLLPCHNLHICQYDTSNPWSLEDMEGMPTKAGLRAAAVY